MKTCNRCHVEKPMDQFYKNNSIADGYRNQCKSCHKHRKRVPVPYQEQLGLFGDTLPISEKINANLKKGSVPSRLELEEFVYQSAESLILDHFREWIMGNNEEFDKVIEEAIYLPQEKRILKKKLKEMIDKW